MVGTLLHLASYDHFIESAETPHTVTLHDQLDKSEIEQQSFVLKSRIDEMGESLMRFILNYLYTV